MSETVTAAVIGGAVSILGAVLAFVAARRARKANRTDELERRIVQRDRDNHRLWYWNRQLVDHIYRGKPPPPPAPPQGLFE